MDSRSNELGSSDGGDILVVDDSPQNLRAIEAALAPLESRLVTVRSGEAALRELLGRDFALVLLDVLMPDMNGFETARLVRSRGRTRHVPIIFITGLGDLADAKQGYELGAVDFLFKPIVPEILRAKARVFLDLHTQRAEVARRGEQLRAMERQAAERRLEEERRTWEADNLRRRVREQFEINRRLEISDQRKDEFLALLSHELRNPLAPLVAGMELVGNTLTADRELAPVAAAMNRQLRHLTHLVDDLLDVSRISRGKLVLRRDNVMFEDIVAAAVVECGDALEADGRTLTLHPPEEPVFVWADEVRLTQVLTNLLGNAAKYTRPGGQIELAWQADGTEVSIVVRDNGLGISPEFLEHMFERFAQERGDGRGLGLGLALSRQIVELHAGSLTARSPGPGEGSVFEVKLPAASSAAIVRPRSPEEATVPDRPLRIVVVDDDDDVRELTCALLRRWHHEVAAAPAAPEGIQRIREQDPDVALVDIAMPGMDGHELAEAVRREHPVRPRLVAVSGYGRQEDRERARSSGYDALLVKPVEPEVLRTILGQLAREMSTRPSGPEVDVPGEGRSKDGSDDDEQRDQADVVRDPGSPGPPAHSGRVAWLRAR